MAAPILTWLSGIVGAIFVEDLIRAILTVVLGSSTFVPISTPLESSIKTTSEDRQQVIDSLIQSEKEADLPMCTEAPAPQLVIDSTAIRVGTIGTVLRNSAGLTALDIGRIKVGEKVRILDGPVCVDEFNWYNIETEDNRVGWVAEGHYRAKRYWYVTVLDDSFCDLPPRFIPGDFATHDSDTRNIVRDFPTRMSDDKGSRIAFGDTVEVLVGPVCNDFHIWYWVRNESLGIEGWTAEGFDDEYWFEEPKRFYN